MSEYEYDRIILNGNDELAIIIYCWPVTTIM